MAYKIHPPIQQNHNDSLRVFASSAITGKRFLFYNPSTREYWEPKTNKNFSSKQALELAEKSTDKIVFCFDPKFPK